MKRKVKTLITLKCNAREVDIIIQALQNQIEKIENTARPANDTRVEEIKTLIEQLSSES